MGSGRVERLLDRDDPAERGPPARSQARDRGVGLLPRRHRRRLDGARGTSRLGLAGLGPALDDGPRHRAHAEPLPVQRLVQLVLRLLRHPLPARHGGSRDVLRRRDQRRVQGHGAAASEPDAALRAESRRALPPRLQRPRHVRHHLGGLRLRRRLGGLCRERAGHVPVRDSRSAARRDRAELGENRRLGLLHGTRHRGRGVQADLVHLVRERLAALVPCRVREVRRSPAALGGVPADVRGVRLRRRRQGRIRAHPGTAHVHLRQRDRARRGGLVRWCLQHLGTQRRGAVQLARHVRLRNLGRSLRRRLALPFHGERLLRRHRRRLRLQHRDLSLSVDADLARLLLRGL
mmetsp:Transcript_18895/g.59365  ORF Transcript_18895/g.59365 Transcript_18895/m.59365 type:complete len:348 (-) Transcript_18895:2378-3421(-)